MITAGEGKHRVQLEKIMIGDDVLLILQGGEKPHIGAVVTCAPGEEPIIEKLGTHKDYVVLEPIAKKACESYQTMIVAVGGIHVDNATKEDIDLIIKNCRRLESCI